MITNRNNPTPECIIRSDPTMDSGKKKSLPLSSLSRNILWSTATKAALILKTSKMDVFPESLLARMLFCTFRRAVWVPRCLCFVSFSSIKAAFSIKIVVFLLLVNMFFRNGGKMFPNFVPISISFRPNVKNIEYLQN